MLLYFLCLCGRFFCDQSVWFVESKGYVQMFTLFILCSVAGNLVVGTKLDIYVFITITGSMHVLVDYHTH